MLKERGTGAHKKVSLQFARISLYTHTHTSLSTVVSASTVAAVKEVMKKIMNNDKVPCVENTT